MLATAFTTHSQAAGIAQPWSGSSLQLIGSAEGKARTALDILHSARALDQAVLVDRARQNERVDEMLARAESAVFAALDAILKARAAVAPAEEA